MTDQQQAQKPPEPQEKSRNSAQDPSKLFGVVSHDELCNTINEQIQLIDEDELFSISGTGYETPKQTPK